MKTYQERHPGELCSDRVRDIPGVASHRCRNLAVDEVHGPMGSWPRCAEHMPPGPMTPEEREVIEAAKEWCKRGGSDYTANVQLRRAVDALPKPSPPLVERLRAWAAGSAGDDDGITEDLLEAAAALERLAK